MQDLHKSHMRDELYPEPSTLQTTALGDSLRYYLRVTKRAAHLETLAPSTAANCMFVDCPICSTLADGPEGEVLLPLSLLQLAPCLTCSHTH